MSCTSFLCGLFDRCLRLVFDERNGYEPIAGTDFADENQIQQTHSAPVEEEEVPVQEARQPTPVPEVTVLDYSDGKFLGNGSRWDEIYKEKSLEELNLRANLLREIPNGLAGLSNLKRLHLGGNPIQRVPGEVCQLFQLTVLVLQNTRLTSLPEAFWELRSLEVLDVSSNQIDHLSSKVGQLVGLKNLYACSMLLSDIPKELGNLPNLQILRLDRNILRKFPLVKGQYLRLTELSLQENQLNNIRSAIGSLRQLVKLDVSKNCLKELPPSLEELKRLQEFRAENNLFKSIPLSVFGLEGLVSLRLSGNEISAIPDEVENLLNLEYFSLRDNPVSKISSNIRSLRKLAELSVENNKLKKVPAALLELPSSCKINITNNRMKRAYKKAFREKLASGGPFVLFDEENDAAIRIQSICRGFLAREKVAKKKTPPLEQARLASVEAALKSRRALTSLPRATQGKVPVYLADQVVIKDLGVPANYMRLQKMRLADQICKKNGYTALVVPKGFISRGFLVETRLPIHSTELFDQIGFYIENKKDFASAAAQLTKFLMQVSLPWTTQEKIFPIVERARYDNLALYAENGEFKIGLIDIERLDTEKEGHTSLKACLAAVTFFPYHLEEIIEAAAEIDPNTKGMRGLLEKRRGEVLNYWELAYYEHKNFLKENQIHETSSRKMVCPTKEDKVEIIRNIEDGLLRSQRRSASQVEYLTENQRNYLDSIIEGLFGLQKARIMEAAIRKEIPSPGALLELRTMRVEFRHFTFGLNEAVVRTLAPYLEQSGGGKIDPFQPILLIVKNLYEKVLEELKTRKVLANYQLDSNFLLIRF